MTVYSKRRSLPMLPSTVAVHSTAKTGWRSGAKLPVEAWDRGDVKLQASGVLQSLDNQIDVTTGTWMSLDVSPDGRTIALAGHRLTRGRVMIDSSIVYGVALVVFAVVLIGLASLRLRREWAAEGMVAQAARGRPTAGPAPWPGCGRHRSARWRSSPA